MYANAKIFDICFTLHVVLLFVLFLLYVNDLPAVSEHLYFIIFTDDTNAFISAPTAKQAVNKYLI